ncbi:MAG: hypothetical protein LBJ08_00750 [Bifidobacteriaceae bacterium]|jgi:hypothetical protein|nr:hypothetical protein [Bifidobacteriaceae bacterium]
MSWDVYLQRFEESYKSIEDIPDRVRTLPLRTLAQVKGEIERLFPEVKWLDAEDRSYWGSWDSRIGSIEFSFDDGTDGVMSVTLFVRAADEVTTRILELAAALNCQALAAPPGDFLDPDDRALGAREWRAYRDQVVGGGGAPR